MGKKYRDSSALVQDKAYAANEAVGLLCTVSTTKFDGTAEIHVRLNIDPKQGDQQVRTIVSLPNGTGKDIRIAAIVPDDLVEAVKKAGAIRAGNQDLIAEIDKGIMEFDAVVAVPTLMKDLGKVARTLGQKGLMPNPKAGTVTADPVSAIRDLKKGRVEIRADKQGIVHSIIGKISFGQEKLQENLQTFITALKEAKPASIKGDFIRSVSLAPTMGPGIKVDIATL